MAQPRIIRHGGSGSVFMNLDVKSTFAEAGENFRVMSGAAAVAMMRTLRLLKTKIKSEAAKAAAESSDTRQKYWKNAMRIHASLDAVSVGGTTFSSGVVTLWVGTNPIPVHRLGKVSWSPFTAKGRRTKGAKVSGKTYAGAWSWGAPSVTGPAVLQRQGKGRLPIKRIDKEPHDAVLNRLAGLQNEMQEWFARRLKEQLRYALSIEAKTPSWGAKARRRYRF